MGWLVIIGVFLGLVVIGGVVVSTNRTWTSMLVFLALLAPAIAFAHLAWVVLMTEDPNPSVGAIILPFALAGIDIVALWAWAYSSNPKATTDATSAAAWGYLGTRAVRGYQRRRDDERAAAVADELERREDDQR